jgi:Na+-transporting methylmalonyl-CoA/oxaloacetate decarboxylase gamma subunit
MKTTVTLLVLLFLTCSIAIYSQDNASSLPQRTPEQEAVKQTEKMQQELNLNTGQAKLIYQINLKYARQRQISNTRSESIERMKNKNSEIERILTSEQNNQLQSKRFERSSFDHQILQSAPIQTNKIPNNQLENRKVNNQSIRSQALPTRVSEFRRNAAAPSRNPQLQNNNNSEVHRNQRFQPVQNATPTTPSKRK